MQMLALVDEGNHTDNTLGLLYYIVCGKKKTKQNTIGFESLRLDQKEGAQWARS